MKKSLKILITMVLALAVLTVLSSCFQNQECSHAHVLRGRVDEIPATELTEGSYDEITYCKDCNAELSRERRTIPKLSCIHKDDNEDFACDKCNQFYVGENHVFHEYDRVAVGEKFLKTPATCNSPAEYYLSCGCGAVGTLSFSYGDPVHSFALRSTDAKYLASEATCKSPTQYYKQCECGLVSDTETFDVGAALPHNYVGGVCERCGDKLVYERNGKYVYFGYYPQSIKPCDVEVSGGVVDGDGNYLGSDGNYYKKVVANPYNSLTKFTNGETVTKGKEYYFKIEPIKWRILEEKDGKLKLLCESIIDVRIFDKNTQHYLNSGIRTWLNEEFFNSAFDPDQQEKILEEYVDMSYQSAGAPNTPEYEGESGRDDRIALISTRELRNKSYGFADNSGIFDDARMRLASDYVRATASEYGIGIGDDGFGIWWTRSLDYHYTNDKAITTVTQDGYAQNTERIDTERGIVPMLWLDTK